MGWPFSSLKKDEQYRLTCEIRPQGSIYSVVPRIDDWIATPSAFGPQAELVSLLSQLEEEGFAQWHDQELMLPWPAFYELACNRDYQDSISLLGLPNIEEWRPVLSSRGSLSDQGFSVILSGWLDPNGRPVHDNVSRTGAQLEHGQTKILLPQAAWETVEAVTIFHQRDSHQRNLEANKLAWAVIRRAAFKANADLTDFLRKTIVLTPERLNIELRKAQFGESKTVEVLPGFDGAPARWLEIFDHLPDTQERYEIADGEGLVHVILAPEVQTVLREIKRMPGRRVAGERAEAFIRNPFAALGPDADKAIDPAQFEQAREQAGISFARFIAKVQRDENGLPVHIALLVEESLHGEIRSEELDLTANDELQRFVTKLEDKIARGAQCCFWEGYDLEILGDTPDQLALLKAALRNLQPSQEFSANEIFDLSRYSERVQGFGVEKPYYSAFIAKKTADDKWFPENVVFGLFYTPDGKDEPIALSLDDTMLGELQEKLQKAKDEGKEIFEFPGCPKPLKVAEAEEMAAIFKEAGSDIRKGVFDPNKARGKTSSIEKIGLVLKPNVDKLDYAAERGVLPLNPQGIKPRLPSSLRNDIQLKDHQLSGLAWLQHLWANSPDNCCGALLADDMGLGKTIQLLAMIATCLEDDPTLDPFLVVAPVSLLENWQEEIAKFFAPGTLPVLTLYGNTLADNRLPRRAIEAELTAAGVCRLLRRDWIGQAKIVLTTYETLRDLEFSLAAQRWSAMICDEAQKIKNPNAMVTRAAKKQNARLKIACTGTPVENTLTDLWCLFDFAQPGLLGALNSFGDRYRRPIEAESEEEKARVEELRTIIAPQIMRRTKAEVAKDLPSKIINTECRSLPISDRQRALYAHAISQFRHRPAAGPSVSGLHSPLGLLQYLRRLCSDPRPPGQLGTERESLAEIEKDSPKMAWLLRKLVKIQTKGEKVIVFCEFRDLQRTLNRAITERFGITADIINGDTSTKSQSATSRQKRIRAFQQKEGFGVIILSPLAVGFGVNIQAANHVVHFTRPWNPAKEDQATDRAYRIGQTKDVFVYYPVITAHDFLSFDAKLDKLLDWKRGLSDDMLNGTGDISSVEFGDLEDVGGGNAFGNEPVSPEDLAAMTPECFEAFCASLWNAHGYSKVYTTPRTGDGGIDVVAIHGNGKIGALIQCKSSSLVDQELGWEAVKDVTAGTAAYAARHSGVAFKKIAVTNQRFNGMASTQANLNHVELVDRDDLIQMLSEKPVKRRDLEFFLLSGAGNQLR
ncbi:MAG: restriction endonuclease [Proteobacteria bacterium]|jgi:SNF2 family DNA or RNA helicase|nr:helicase SNF2 [Desulfocapsa sp.]MBU3943997.1 restriction endonuclease [Pseudomonadota bacterium]MCG2742606.1 SNF2-related protein [Desulfobacteraceae bacterium]MBU4029466.1 restriction endonuclease [Pseudomonadota bacterium]MBU4043242.1 restriction endonuclease [Pseudomonadota bacterium]